MRETQNIFYYLSIGNFKRAWYFIKYFDKTTRKDSKYGFLEITICKIFGHKTYLNSYNDIRCSRCQKYIRTLSHEQSTQYKREQKLKRVV